MKLSTIEKIAGNDPVDSIAARVIRPGIHYDRPEIRERGRFHSEICPPLAGPPPSGIDLTGQVKGRLTVIGLMLKPPKPKKKGKWVVRCSCGAFETRSAKALSSKDNVSIDDRCQKCQLEREFRSGKLKRYY